MQRRHSGLIGPITHRDESTLNVTLFHRFRAHLLAAALLLFPAAALATATTPSGVLPEAVLRAFDSGALAGTPAPSPTHTTAQQSDWLVPVLLVSYADTSVRIPPAQIQFALFDTTHSTPTGSVVDYYDWASGGRLRIRGEVVGTVQLSGTRQYYSNDSYGLNVTSTPNNDAGLLREAISRLGSAVDWSRYDRDGDGFVDMLWVVHAGLGGELSGSRLDMWSVTSRMSAGWSNANAIETNSLLPGSATQKIRVDRFSMLPEMSGFRPGQMSEIGVFCHEFGHALGLPDLYDTSQLGGTGNVGPGNWSLMSTGAYGGDNRSPQTPVGMGAWPMLFLGWADRLRPAQDTTLTLRPISAGGPVVEFAFQGENESEHFLVENRARTLFDRNLPDHGLLLYQVDEASIGQRIASNRVNAGLTPGLRVVEADGHTDLTAGGNRGDSGDPLPGTSHRVRMDDETTPSLRSVAGAENNLALEDITLLGDDARATFRVRAPGWLPAREVSDPLYAPAGAVSTISHRSVVTPQGGVFTVSADARTGRPQITLQARAFRGTWSTPSNITSSPSAAYDPALALLPGNDLAIAWLDTRSGLPQLWYRSRIGGVWTAETQMSRSTVGCTSPAIASDAHGRVFLSWLEVLDTGPRLMFMRFNWASPFGQALVVSQATDLPSAPVITAAPDGHAYILWSDRRSTRPQILFARYAPDSGLFARLPLTGASGYAQPSLAAEADANGTLHVLWQQTGSGLNEVHYQQRFANSAPAPRDTAMESIPDALQNPRISVDLLGGLHMSYERITGIGTQLRYKRWRPGLGWDFRGTEISVPSDGSISHADVLPVSNGVVSLVYTGFDGQRERLVERVRQLDQLVAAAPVPVAAHLPSVRMGPSPLRPGQALDVSGVPLDGGREGVVELFDATGRRLASVRAVAGHARFGSEVTRALAPGLYLTRVRGASSGRLVVIR